MNAWVNGPVGQISAEWFSDLNSDLQTQIHPRFAVQSNYCLVVVFSEDLIELLVVLLFGVRPWP